jgi:hypothetical protein
VGHAGEGNPPSIHGRNGAWIKEFVVNFSLIQNESPAYMHERIGRQLQIVSLQLTPSDVFRSWMLEDWSFPRQEISLWIYARTPFPLQVTKILLSLVDMTNH